MFGEAVLYSALFSPTIGCMDTSTSDYRKSIPAHLAALQSLQDNFRLEPAERIAVEQSRRFMQAAWEHPEVSSLLFDILSKEDAQTRHLRARTYSPVIWGRIDKIVRNATTDTFNLGRVSHEMLDAAASLRDAAVRLRDRLSPGAEDEEALHEIEAAAHPLRTAAKSLSGSTPTAIKIDHDGLEKIIAHWSAIQSVEGLHEIFDRLGVAWEDREPGAAPAPSLPPRAIKAKP